MVVRDSFFPSRGGSFNFIQIALFRKHGNDHLSILIFLITYSASISFQIVKGYFQNFKKLSQIKHVFNEIMLYTIKWF